MSITSANAILTLSQAVLFPTPQQIQGFAADDIFDMEQVRSVEAVMGVDGVLSFGFVWAARLMNIMLQADSPSNAFFDTIDTQQEAAQDVYPISGLVVLSGISTKFQMINGGLTGYTPTPGVKKTLTPRRYQITWGRVFPQPS